MRLSMQQHEPSRGSNARRLSLEAAAGSFVGASIAGAAALLLHAQTASWPLALAGVVATSICLAYWTHRRTRRDFALIDAIHETVDSLSDGSRIARLDERRLDSSFASAARCFNRIFDVMSEVANRVLAIVHGVRSLPDRISEVLSQIEASASGQEEAVEETASLLANINKSMLDIGERIERLQQAADESASSILQMGDSVDEVARNAATLHESVEASASSVHEIGASIRQVAESAEHVERIAGETASSMLEMDRVVQDVSGHTREASELTRKVSEGAERGSEAVTETITDIQRIHDRTIEARDSLGKLVSRVSAIGGILTVIGEINDETNLLSLNAAIIAAQAGEQGKAFLVVANHVKTLARRTAASTEDIEGLIRDIQSESDAAVSTMGAGFEAIETGVARSQAAGEALGEILTSSRAAFDRVEGIARATDEQSRSSKLVAGAAQETSNQVRQISSAMAEQSKVSEQLLQNSEAALDLCRHVYRSTDEQRQTGRYIAESISSITDMIRLIRDNSASHAKASDSVSQAVTRLLDNARQSGNRVSDVNAMLRELSDSAQSIVAELARFEGSGIGFAD